MIDLRLYFTKYPLISSEKLIFTIGYIDSTGALNPININDSNLSIRVIEPDKYNLDIPNSSITINPSSTPVSLLLELSYKQSGILQIIKRFSYSVMPKINYINQDYLLNLLKRFLPQCYNIVYNTNINTRLNAIASVLYNIYTQENNKSSYSLNGGLVKSPATISNLISTIYPNSGDSNWEELLTGTKRLLYQNSNNYGRLLQHIYAVNKNNDNNPYYVALNISKFIYLWLGLKYYVYLDENTFNLIDGFILNFSDNIISSNTLSRTYLQGTSGQLDLVIYILPDPVSKPVAITTDQQQEIINYIYNLIRPNILIDIKFNYTIPELQLSYLGNTYLGDLRQNYTYCLLYNDGVLENATGYNVDSINIDKIVSFKIIFTVGLGKYIFTYGDTSLSIPNGNYKVACQISYDNQTYSDSISALNNLNIWNYDNVISLNYQNGVQSVNFNFGSSNSSTISFYLYKLGAYKINITKIANS